MLRRVHIRCRSKIYVPIVNVHVHDHKFCILPSSFSSISQHHAGGGDVVELITYHDMSDAKEERGSTHGRCH